MKATKKITKVDPEAQLRMNERKWTKPLMAARFTVVPYVVLDRQDAIGLTPVEVNVLMLLANHWWQADNLPDPSKRSLAKRLGVSEKTIQRAVKRLEDVRFIKRKYRYHPVTHGQQTNFYDFSGLIAAAEPYAEEERERRKAREVQQATRGDRKKPRPHLLDEKE